MVGSSTDDADPYPAALGWNRDRQGSPLRGAGAITALHDAAFARRPLGPVQRRLVDAKSGDRLCTLYPLDKLRNAGGMRRPTDTDTMAFRCHSRGQYRYGERECGRRIAARARDTRGQPSAAISPVCYVRVLEHGVERPAREGFGRSVDASSVRSTFRDVISELYTET